MKWNHHSNRRLLEAIVASFYESPERAASRLARFDEGDWKQTDFWLDTSGLALYFLDRIESVGVAESIDPRTLSRLREKMANNRVRTGDLMQEFVALNQLFLRAGLCFANVKGFTLSPASCRDPSLRHQSDYDFLIDPADLDTARRSLEERGYRVTGKTARTLEFKSGTVQKVSLEGHYKPKPVRAVELHTSIDSQDFASTPGLRDHRLDRWIAWECGAESFPALCEADQFIGQALHLLGHLLGEHTRPSWLLEFRRHATYRQHDAAFWQDVARLADERSEARLAIGLSAVLAKEVFGSFPITSLCEHFQNSLPVEVQLWAKMYGRRAMLAEVPGTKLCRLLERAIAKSGSASQPRKPLLRLVPLHAPPRILRAPAKDTLRLRLHREWIQVQYILYRASFHLREALRVKFESWRWERALTRLTASREDSANGCHDDVLLPEGESAR